MKRTDLYILSYFYLTGREEVKYKEIVTQAVNAGYYKDEKSAYATLYRAIQRLMKMKYIIVKHDLINDNQGFRSYVIRITELGYLAISSWWKKKMLAMPSMSPP